MQRSLVLIVPPFLLLLLLGKASTLPLVDSQDEGVNADIIPVVFVVDPYSSLEPEEPTGGKSLEDGGVRRRRQTTVSGGVNREDLGGGAHRDSGNINVSHKFNKHTVTGGVTVDRTKVPGLGSSRNLGVNAGYEFRPNKNTAFNIGVSHSRGTAGRATNFGAGFSHTFGRR